MAPWPVVTAAGQSLACGLVQSLAACALRYLVKLSVVPDESLRWNAAMVASGSVTPEFAEAIFGSFHFVMEPE